MLAFLLGSPVETLLGNFFTGCTCCSYSGYAYMIITLRGSAWIIGKIYILYWRCSIYTTLGGLAVEVALSICFVRVLNSSLCEFTSVTIGMSGAGFCS